MPGVICYAIAKYNYEPQRDDELRLAKNDQLNVLDKSADGWWKAQVRFYGHFLFCSELPMAFLFVAAK